MGVSKASRVFSSHEYIAVCSLQIQFQGALINYSIGVVWPFASPSLKELELSLPLDNIKAALQDSFPAPRGLDNTS